MLLSWAVMFLRVLVMVLVVNRTLLGPLLVPFLAMAAAASLIGWHYHRLSPHKPSAQGVPLTNPFSLTAAARFAASFALVLLVVRLAQVYAPEAGVYFVAGLAGTTDVDAITLSMSQYASSGGDVAVAVRAITVAALANTVVKTGMAVALGSAELRRSILKSTPVILAAGGAALLLMT
jgi:uncharacterized membrane protein (DUF4010 family)